MSCWRNVSPYRPLQTHYRRDNAVLLWMMLDAATREMACWAPVVTIESADFHAGFVLLG